MDVRNIFRRVATFGGGRSDESASFHQRTWAANRANISSWNEDDADDASLSGGQSSSGREPRRVVRASGRVGADRGYHRYSR